MPAAAASMEKAVLLVTSPRCYFLVESLSGVALGTAGGDGAVSGEMTTWWSEPPVTVRLAVSVSPR